MTTLTRARSFVAVPALALFALGAASAQQPVQPGSTLTPASAAPQTDAQPNLRVDSKPHTDLSPSTDSAPLPETLGMDATPLMDLGLDWSLPQDTTVASTLRRLVTKNGQTTVVEVQTLPAAPLPITNPPDPPSTQILNIPQPPIVQKPLPPDPLTAISQ